MERPRVKLDSMDVDREYEGPADMGPWTEV